MITPQDIMKTARHIAEQGEGRGRRSFLCPAREWHIGLIVGTVLFLACVAGAGFIFWKHLTAQDPMVAPEVAAYDPKLIKKALETYRTRKERYESLGGAVFEAKATAPATTSAPAALPETVAE